MLDFSAAALSGAVGRSANVESVRARMTSAMVQRPVLVRLGRQVLHSRQRPIVEQLAQADPLDAEDAVVEREVDPD